MGFNFNMIRKWCMNKAINLIVVIAFLIFVVFVIFAASIGSGCSSIIANSNAVLSSKK